MLLPAPVAPTMAMHSPGCDLEVDSVEHRRLGSVAEGDVLEIGRVPAPGSSGIGCGGTADFQRRVEHFEHALGAGQAGLNAVGDIRDLADLVGELLRAGWRTRTDPSPRAQLP